MTSQPDRTTGALIAEVLAGLSRLVRGEVALAKAEAATAARSALQALMWGVGAAVLGIVALTLLAQAGVHGLIAAGLAPPLAMLAVAAGLLVLAVIAARVCSGLLHRAGQFGDRSARNIRRDLQSLQTMVTPDATFR